MRNDIINLIKNDDYVRMAIAEAVIEVSETPELKEAILKDLETKRHAQKIRSLLPMSMDVSNWSDKQIILLEPLIKDNMHEGEK